MKVTQPGEKLVTLRLQNTNIIIHGLKNIINLKNLEYSKLYGEEMLFLDLCKNLDNLNIIDCEELTHITMVNYKNI